MFRNRDKSLTLNSHAGVTEYHLLVLVNCAANESWGFCNNTVSIGLGVGHVADKL